MGVWPTTWRVRTFLSVLVGMLPTVREIAQETLSRARDRYHAGRTGRELAPLVSWLDPDVWARFVSSVPTGRLTRLLVDARPMGP